MPDTPPATVDLPSAMGVAGALAYTQHTWTQYAYGNGRHGLECSCGFRRDHTDPIMEDEDGIPAYTAVVAAHTASVVLAAALSTCTVRPEWRAKITYADGSVGHTAWCLDREGAEWSGEYERRRHYTAAFTIERRLVFETPAEEVE